MINILKKNFTAGFSLHSYELSQRICYAFAEATEGSLYKVLGRLKLTTDDVDGLDSTSLGKLSDGQADGRRSGVLDDEVSRFKLSEIVEKSVGNTGSAEKNGGGFGRNVLRKFLCFSMWDF